jgi:myo-inositol-1(or 4)-monophosphatase
VKPTLDFIKTIAAQAGDILLNLADSDLNIQHKSRIDLVTKADHDSEQFLINAILTAFPEHAIVAEESGAWAGAQDHQWYIDPLDGTLNYAHGVPIYCVSIGYACQGRMELGVVYDPTRGEFFSAQRGHGATLNGQPIHVSGFTDLIDCMLGTGFPKGIAEPTDNNVLNFIRFSQVAQSVRRLGSAALAIAYAGAGRLDGFWEVDIHQWDIAAGGLIVQEAGGVVTDIFGEPDYMKNPPSFLCANPVIHQKMLDVFTDVHKTEKRA